MQQQILKFNSTSLQVYFDKLIIKPEASEMNKTAIYIIDKISHFLENCMGKYLPLTSSNKEIKIISLGCGIPLEYISLYDYYTQQKIQIDYVGLDISTQSTVHTSEMFRNFPNCTLLTGDCSHRENVKKILSGANKLPEYGYDLIVLRHPDLTTTTRKQDFINMLSDVIPYIASTDSRVYISCYHESELNELAALVYNNKLYYNPGPKNLIVEASSPGTTLYIDKVHLEPESYALIMGCYGYAFEQKLIKNTSISAIKDQTSADSLIALKQLSDPRISFDLGKTLISQQKPKEALVAFNKALAIYQTSKQISIECAICLSCIASCHRDLEDYNPALDCCNQSIKIYEQLLAINHNKDTVDGLQKVKDKLAKLLPKLTKKI